MHIAVTGGAGFIGANLVRVLRHDPAVSDIRVIDDLSTGSRSNLETCGDVLVEGSILDDELLRSAFEGVDAVVHLAARPSVPRSIDDPMATHRTNATGTLAVLEAARHSGQPHVIIASSSSVYGDGAASPKHEGLAPTPMSPYAASKLAAEGYAQAYAAVWGVRVLVLRFFNVFGPLQPAGHAYAAAVPAFITAAIVGDPLPVYGDGRQTRDFTYVGDVASVLIEGLHNGIVHPAPVNLAFGSSRTLLEVRDLIADVLGKPLDVVHLPPREGDVRHSESDRRLFDQLFPRVPSTPFDEAIRTTVEWFQNTR